MKERGIWKIKMGSLEDLSVDNILELARDREIEVQKEFNNKYMEMHEGAQSLKRNEKGSKYRYLMAIIDYELFRENVLKKYGIKPELNVDLDNWKKIIPDFDSNVYKIIIGSFRD